MIASRFKICYNPFHSNFQLPLKAIKLLEKKERKLRFYFKKLQQLQHTSGNSGRFPLSQTLRFKASKSFVADGSGIIRFITTGSKTKPLHSRVFYPNRNSTIDLRRNGIIRPRETFLIPEILFSISSVAFHSSPRIFRKV